MRRKQRVDSELLEWFKEALRPHYELQALEMTLAYEKMISQYKKAIKNKKRSKKK